MAKVSRRLGRLGVDYTDETGRRRWKTFRTEEEAQIFLGEQLIRGGKPLSGDPGITLAEYAHTRRSSQRPRNSRRVNPDFP